MTIPDWVNDAIFYQIFPDRFRNGDPSNDPPGVEPWGAEPTRENFFGGDLAGVTEGLPYIKELGCNALYLNPIFQAGTNHRYDTDDYFEIDPALGDDADFDRLITRAHELGVRVVLDGVFNHCGVGFAPFSDVVVNGLDSRYRGWFDVYDFPVRVGEPANYATCGGAHYLPRLNTREPEVEAFIHEVALHWLSRGIDGWRLDVPYEIYTEFWRGFRRVVKEAYPDAYLVAEEWRDPSAFLGGDTFDGATDYQLKGLIFDFVAKRALTGEAFLRAYETLRSGRPTGSAAGMLNVMGSHDTSRVMTEFGDDEDLVRLAYTALFTLPGAPLVYYGDEVGMTGGNDPACRRTFSWNEHDWNVPLREYLQRLAVLRTSHPCLRRGTLTQAFGNDRVASYVRAYEGEAALVILNASELSRDLRVPVPFCDGTKLTDLLRDETFEVQQGCIHFEPLNPRTAMVLLTGGN